MKACHLRKYIIEPVLEYMNKGGNDAVNLLLGTAAVESDLFRIRQIGYKLISLLIAVRKNGAYGLWQMELFTHDSLFNDYLNYRPALKTKVLNFYDRNGSVSQNLISNHFYAAAMARIKYLTVPEKLPKADDIEGMAVYWKKYYNTEKGKGTAIKFIENYKGYILNA